MITSATFFATVFTTALLSGCSLPLMMSGGGAVVVPYHGRTQVVPELRTGFHPLGLAKDLAHRPVDVGTGITVRWEDLATKDAHAKSELFFEASGLDVHPNEDGDDYRRESYGGSLTFWPGKERRVGVEGIFREEELLFIDMQEKKTYSQGELGISVYGGIAIDTQKVTLSGGAGVCFPFFATVDLPDRM